VVPAAGSDRQQHCDRCGEQQPAQPEPHGVSVARCRTTLTGRTPSA
jgi:hypothetical protein